MKQYARLAQLAATCLLVFACGEDETPAPNDGSASEVDASSVDRTIGIPAALGELVDTATLFDSSTIVYGIDEVRSGRVPGDFGEPVWQIGVTFTSQTFLGQPWTHSAVLVIPDTLPTGVRHAAVLPRTTENPVDGVSDSESFLPQFAAITADRLDIPILLVDNIPPSIDLRNVSDLQGYQAQNPQCFAGPLNDDDEIADCLWSIAQKAGRPDWFPALPTAVAYVRTITLMELLSNDVESFNLGFEVPPFQVEEVVVLGSGLGGHGLRYAMAMDSRIRGVMASSADIGSFDAFFDLQTSSWAGEYSYGNPQEQSSFWGSAAATPFRDAFALDSLEDALADRAYLMAVGTNDRRFPLTAFNLYAEDLPTDHATLYVSNYGSGFGTLDHLLAWRVFLSHVFSGRSWAQLETSVEDDGGNVTVSARVDTTTIVTAVDLWYTQRHSDADDSDFRDAIWRSVPMDRGADGYSATVAPLASNTAFFVRVSDAQDIFEGPICSEIQTILR